MQCVYVIYMYRYRGSNVMQKKGRADEWSSHCPHPSVPPHRCWMARKLPVIGLSLRFRRDKISPNPSSPSSTSPLPLPSKRAIPPSRRTPRERLEGREEVAGAPARGDEEEDEEVVEERRGTRGGDGWEVDGGMDVDGTWEGELTGLGLSHGRVERIGGAVEWSRRETEGRKRRKGEGKIRRPRE